MSRTSLLVFSIILFIHQIDPSDSSEKGFHVKFFDNVAEINEPVSTLDLPKSFSQAQWLDLRPDSIRLSGRFLRVFSQSQSFNQPSINGKKVLIQRQTTNSILTEAIMIDESRNLIHDLTDGTYYTINNDRIRYLTIPGTRNYTVDFQYERTHPEQLYLRYLRNNIRWRVQYDLILSENDTDSFLRAYAEIRNDGNSLMAVESAELISGDINIQSSSSVAGFGGSFNDEAFGYDMNQHARPASIAAAPMIAEAQELSGVYVFPINQSFILEPRSNFIFQMFQPKINIERFGIINKAFSRMNNRGSARRAYRLAVPEYYLPKGQVFIRESDRLVGETTWSERSANETNEFTLGLDPDLLFIEAVNLKERRQAHEANGYRIVLSTYNIQLTMINKKNRPMNFQYRLRFSSQEYLVLKENTPENHLTIDGSTVFGLFNINTEGEMKIEFTIETQ